MSLEVPRQSTIAQVPSRHQRERKRAGSAAAVSGNGGSNGFKDSVNEISVPGFNSPTSGSTQTFSPRSDPSTPSPRSQDNIYFRRDHSNGSKPSSSVMASRRSRMKTSGTAGNSTISSSKSSNLSVKRGRSVSVSNQELQSSPDGRNLTLRSSHSQSPSAWYNPAVTHSPRLSTGEFPRDSTLKSIKESNILRPKKPSSRHSLKEDIDASTPKAGHSSMSHGTTEDSPHSPEENVSRTNSSGSTNSSGTPNLQSQTSARLPRPGSSSKPRPISHKKKARPRLPQPPSENVDLPPPAPQERRGALGKSKSKKNEAASKSFLGSSFLNLSFFLPKSNSSANLSTPVAPTNDQHQPSNLPRVNSSIPVDKYPTNENSLARMASYAVLPSTDSFSAASAGGGLNSYLHPAAAGLDTNKMIRHSSALQLNKLRQKSDVSGGGAGGGGEVHNSDEIVNTEKRDFSRFYRQGSSSNSSSFAEESDFFRIANFALDCGPSLDQKILSYKHATHVAAFLHPGLVDEDGHLSQHPLSSDFGWFEYPFKNFFRRQKSAEPNVLEKYGVGISLWFKFLKAFSVIFFVMFLITSPSLIFFIRGSQSGVDQRNYMTSTSPSDILFMTTLGNLGTTQNLCFTVQPETEVNLKCQGKGTIIGISAYYGHPNGSCTCPVPQQPTIADVCPGKILKDGCSKDMYGKEEACYLSRYELGYGDPQPCCAYQKIDGKPSLSDLSIKPNYGCNSMTAQYVAEGMCLGRSSCTLRASDSHLFSWKGTYAKNIPANVCASSIKNSKNLMLNQCNTTLTHLGSWEDCPLTETTQDRFLQIQAVCSPERIGTSENSFSKSTVVIIASVLNSIAILTFTFAVYWVAIQQKTEEAIMDRNTCRAKDFTVCLTHIPPVYSSTQDLAKKLKRHFEKVLSSTKPCFLPGSVRVADINFTTGSYSVLQTAINRGQAARELDAILYKKNVLEYLGRQSSWRYKFLEWREKEWHKKYQYWNDKCLRSTSDTSKTVKRAYVTFESEEGYKRCLRVFSSNSLNHYFDHPEYLLEDKEILTAPAEDPSDILWENLGTSRVERTLRRLLTNILLFALILLTYVAVDAATSSTLELEQGYPTQIDCNDYQVDLNRSNLDHTIASLITYDRVLRDVEWQYYNNSFGRQGFLNCYCREVYLEDGLKSMLQYKFEDPQDHDQEKWCSGIAYGFLKVTLLRIVVAIVVVGVNVSAKSILRGLKDFEKRSSYSAISTSMTFKLFLVQVVNAGLLILLMNGYIRNFNNSSSISFLNGKYSDFTIDWYGDVGKSLIGTMILYMFGVHGLKFALLFYTKLRRWQDTHFTGDTRLTYQVSQEQLNRLYIGTEFVIEVRYATVLTICFVCIAYASTMPIMYLVASVAFTLHYWIDKYFFLRVNRIPRAVSPTLALHVTRTFYVAGFINLCIAIWTFSNVDVFDPPVEVHKEIISYSGLNYLDVSINYLRYRSFYERLFNQYTIASWLGLAPLIFGVMIFTSLSLIKTYGHHFNLCVRYFSHLLQHESTYEGHPEYFDSIPLYLLRRRVEDGIVKKHILERYKQRIKDLETHPQKMTGKQLEGLESYDIGLNEIYADKFALNSDFILRRRPPDLFHAECKDEESGLLVSGVSSTQFRPQSSPQDRPSPSGGNRQNILPFVGSKSHESPKSALESSSPRQLPPQRSPRKSPRSEPPPPNPSRARPPLEHIPSACSILNDDVVAEIHNVSELF